MREPAPGPAGPPAPPRAGATLRVAWPGALLFLFVPAVLFLFVAHPAPVGLSLAAGVALMLGHRYLARPHLFWALPRKCLWCGRALPAGAETLVLATSGDALVARSCPGHGDPAARFLAFTHAWRWPLRVGVLAPLLTLLVTLGAHAAGAAVPLDAVTRAFQLAIGVTVNVAAWGFLAARPERPARVAVPVHNLFLLGVRGLLWILRVVGLWWIARGVAYFWGGR